MGSLNLHSNILIIITIIQSHHCWSPTATAQSVRVSAWYHSIISIIIILGHHCFVSPGFGLPITVSSSSLSFLILYSLLSVSGSRPALCSIDPSGCYQTDKIYNIIHSFTLVILSMHRKGSAKCALQFINFDIDTNKQYSEKVQACVLIPVRMAILNSAKPVLYYLWPVSYLGF